MKCSLQYPHIIDSGAQEEIAQLSKEELDALFVNDKQGAHIRTILSSLQTLNWKRYDVLFDNWYVSTLLHWVNFAQAISHARCNEVQMA